MSRRFHVIQYTLVAGLILGLATDALAKKTDEFDEAEVLVEINATDGDAGFQGKVDGEAWNKIGLRGPNGRMFGFKLKGDARKQGFTEFVWESAEPQFDEFGLAEFLERFPEGRYTFVAKTNEGGFLKSSTELTHDLPAGPTITAPEEGAGVPSGADLLVTWDAVTTVFEVDDPTGEATDPLESDVVRYIVVAEYEDEEEDVKEVLTIEVHVASDDDSASFSATIPGDFLKFADSDGYKVEVGVVEESGNRTFTEQEFCTDADCEEDPEEE